MIIFDLGRGEPYACHNCKQTISIHQSPICVRTLHGELHIFPNNRKYTTQITCKNADITNVITTGVVVKIGCMNRFWVDVTTPCQVSLDRDPVNGSVYGLKAHRELKPLPNKRIFTLDDVSIKKISYRPWLEMHITHMSVNQDGVVCVDAQEL